MTSMNITQEFGMPEDFGPWEPHSGRVGGFTGTQMCGESEESGDSGDRDYPVQTVHQHIHCSEPSSLQVEGWCITWEGARMMSRKVLALESRHRIIYRIIIYRISRHRKRYWENERNIIFQIIFQVTIWDWRGRWRGRYRGWKRE